MLTALVAECIGTFALIFVGVIAIANNALALGLTGIALAHGLTIACLASATGHLSGGHLNPAVTVGFVAARKMSPGTGLAYILAQLIGATVAAFLARAVVPAAVAEAISAGAGTPSIAPGVSVGAAVLLEAVLTFFLVFVIFGTAVDSRGPKVGALFIGFTVALDIMVGGPITGAAMNPARHLGPALAAGTLSDFWVYWVGPLIGALLAAGLYSHVLAKKS